MECWDRVWTLQTTTGAHDHDCVTEGRGLEGDLGSKHTPNHTADNPLTPHMPFSSLPRTHEEAPEPSAAAIEVPQSYCVPNTRVTCRNGQNGRRVPGSRGETLPDGF